VRPLILKENAARLLKLAWQPSAPNLGRNPRPVTLALAVVDRSWSRADPAKLREGESERQAALAQEGPQLTYQDGFAHAQTHLDNEDGDQWPAWLQSRAWRTLSRWHSHRSSCFPELRLYSAFFRHVSHVWPIASTRWLSN
jgi:hypothetical protein